MTARRKILIRVGSSVLLFALLGGVSVTKGQQNAVGSVLPVVGIGVGQVLRIAVSAFPPDPFRDNGQRCQATLSFLDIRTHLAVGSSRFFDLAPGEADFVDLDSGTLGLRRGQRKDVQPVLAPSAESSRCRVSYAVLGVVGRLLTYVDKIDAFHVKGKICEESLGVSPLLSDLGTGQTLQYTVVRTTLPFDDNNNPRPCDITVTIRRGGGPSSPVVVSLVTGPLGPGEMATTSVNGNSLGLSLGETAFLSQEVLSTVVQIPVGGQICPVSTFAGCITSVQVIDNLTAWTTVLHIPFQVP